MPSCDLKHRIVAILVVEARAIAYNRDPRWEHRRGDHGCINRTANTPAHAIKDRVTRTHAMNTKTTMRKNAEDNLTTKSTKAKHVKSAY